MDDPYSQWLGIEPGPRPPNYYALLGAPEFTDDLDRLRQAYRERYALVRGYQSGRFGQRAVQLLDELTRAFDCLSHPTRRREYDLTLLTEAAETLLPSTVGKSASGQDAPPDATPAPTETSDSGWSAPADWSDLCGVRLGRHTAQIAYVTPWGEAKLVHDAEGLLATPAVVYVDGEEAAAGTAAERGERVGAGRVASELRDALGQSWYPRTVDGRRWRPETLAALLLRRLKRDAELAARPLKRVVIAVPESFGPGQLRAVESAAILAGFDACETVSEPIAAANAALRRGAMLLPVDARLQPRTLLVVHVQNDRIEATVAHASPRPEAGRLEIVALASRAAPVGGDAIRARLIGEFLSQLEEVVEGVCEPTRIGRQDIDSVVPIGAAARSPLIQATLRRILERPLETRLPPEESIVRGAAVFEAFDNWRLGAEELRRQWELVRSTRIH